MAGKRTSVWALSPHILFPVLVIVKAQIPTRNQCTSKKVHTLTVQISIHEVHVKREVHKRFLQIIKGESLAIRAQRLGRIRSAQAVISSVVENQEERADNDGI